VASSHRTASLALPQIAELRLAPEPPSSCCPRRRLSVGVGPPDAMRFGLVARYSDHREKPMLQLKPLNRGAGRPTRNFVTT